MNNRSKKTKNPPKMQRKRWPRQNQIVKRSRKSLFSPSQNDRMHQLVSSKFLMSKTYMYHIQTIKNDLFYAWYYPSVWKTSCKMIMILSPSNKKLFQYRHPSRQLNYSPNSTNHPIKLILSLFSIKYSARNYCTNLSGQCLLTFWDRIGMRIQTLRNGYFFYIRKDEYLLRLDPV